MRPTLTAKLLMLAAVAYLVAALFVPREGIEVLGGLLVVAGGYFAGRRGGVLTALWATGGAAVAFFAVGSLEVDDFVVTVVGYLILGTALGIGVERFRTQQSELEDAMTSMHAFQRQLSASQKRYRLLFEGSHDAVFLHGLDAHGEPTCFVAVNDAACERLGYTRDELLGLLPRVVDAAPRPGQLREVMALLVKQERVRFETALRSRQGEAFPVEVSASLTDVDGELMVLSIARDISARKEQEQQLVELSLHDQLTGLLNRRGFLVMLPELSKRAKRLGAPMVVLYADLDGLKGINDALGHARGDEAIAAVAEALRHTFRESDLIARLGGDEFCVVAEAESETDPALLQMRLEGALEMSGAALGLSLSMSYGSVISGWDGLRDPDGLLARADAAMYATKRERKAERAATLKESGSVG